MNEISVGCPIVDRLGKTNEDYIINLKKPKIPSDSAIEVYYIETPLGGQGTPGYKPQPGELKPYGVIYNVNHTGIGFRIISKNRVNMEFVFNLRVNDFGIYILLPHINENSKGFSDMDWCNQVLLTYIPIIDRTYWLKSDYICTINKDDFYALIDWIQGDYQKKRTAYIFLSVIKDVNRKDIFNPIRKSYLCDDFCYDVLWYLQNVRNIAIQYVTVPNYNIATFVIGDNSIKELDMSIEKNRDMVYNYYLSIKTIFGDIFNIINVLKDNKASPEIKALALKKLENDLIKFFGPKAEKYISEFLNDILALGKDILDIVEKLKINPKDPEGKELINVWEKFMNDKTVETFYSFIEAFGTYILQKVRLGDLEKVKIDYEKLKGILPKIMAGFSEVIYYGYTDDYRLTYFLIEGPVGFYANYLEANLYRDLPSMDIYGKIVSDPYTHINYNRRLIGNNIYRKNWIFPLLILCIFMIFLISTRK